MNERIQTILRIKNTPSPTEEALFEHTQKYMWYISWIPGLRMVAICNSLSMYAGDADSDIDLFIVTDPQRMWLVRILVTAIFQFLWVRRHGKYVAGRFCLSFFCTTEGLDLSKIAIEEDIYLRTWVEYLKPIYDQGDCYKLFLNKNNHWVDVSDAEKKENIKYLIGKSKKSPEWFGRFWSMLDSGFRKIFEPVTLREYERLGRPWGIIISSEMLKFHKNDRRREFGVRPGTKQEVSSGGRPHWA